MNSGSTFGLPSLVQCEAMGHGLRAVDFTNFDRRPTLQIIARVATEMRLQNVPSQTISNTFSAINAITRSDLRINVKPVLQASREELELFALGFDTTYARQDALMVQSQQARWDAFDAMF